MDLGGDLFVAVALPASTATGNGTRSPDSPSTSGLPAAAGRAGAGARADGPFEVFRAGGRGHGDRRAGGRQGPGPLPPDSSDEGDAAAPRPGQAGDEPVLDALRAATELHASLSQVRTHMETVRPSWLGGRACVGPGAPTEKNGRGASIALRSRRPHSNPVRVRAFFSFPTHNVPPGLPALRRARLHPVGRRERHGRGRPDWVRQHAGLPVRSIFFWRGKTGGPGLSDSPTLRELWLTQPSTMALGPPPTPGGANR